MGYQKVLVPVSGKQHLERAERALEQALQIVQDDGEICFLHCVDDMPHLIVGDEQRKLVMGDTTEAEKVIQPLAARVKSAGIAYSVHIVEGSPVTHIPRFASERAVNAVVMCTDGHDEPGRLTIGGITARVFPFLRVPLMVVH
jgi:nucleotide-binding universal stress UspA family protein